jgi:hypothetical protein
VFDKDEDGMMAAVKIDIMQFLADLKIAVEHKKPFDFIKFYSGTAFGTDLIQTSTVNVNNENISIALYLHKVSNDKEKNIILTGKYGIQYENRRIFTNNLQEMQVIVFSYQNRPDIAIELIVPYSQSDAFNQYFFDKDPFVVKVGGELSGEWQFNVETGDLTFIRDWFGDEENILILHYIDNSGKIVKETKIRETATDLYLNYCMDDYTKQPIWLLTPINYWDGIPDGYNVNRPSNYPYEYRKSDLMLRYAILQSSNQSIFDQDVILKAIREKESKGIAEPLTSGAFWELYGATLGGLLSMETVIEAAGLTGMGQTSNTSQFIGIRPKVAKFDNSRTTTKRNSTSDKEVASTGNTKSNLGKYIKQIGDYEVYEGGEVFYRGMTNTDYTVLVSTGKLPATSETFTSPTLEYIRAVGYGDNGVTVKFQMKRGTISKLEQIGVRNDASDHLMKTYSELPLVSKGWKSNNALFKTEGGDYNLTQINIGLGNGKALDIFNDNIISHQIIK